MQANNAVKEFTFEEDCREFNKCYNDDIIKYLIHRDSLEQSFLKYVFLDGYNFIEQLQSLRAIQIETNKDFCFICKEPGVGKNHYIFGILANDKIVFINPLGITSHLDFYDTAQKVKQEFNLEIYISVNKLQKDDDGLYSCGPIVTELMQHISKLTSQEIFEALSSQNLELQEKKGVKYTQCNIEKLLPSSLNFLEAGIEQYKEKILFIRITHHEILVKSQGIIDLKEQNEYWDQILNNPVQTIINASILDKKLVTNSAQEIIKYLHSISSVNNSQNSKMVVDPTVKSTSSEKDKQFQMEQNMLVEKDTEILEKNILTVQESKLTQDLNILKEIKEFMSQIFELKDNQKQIIILQKIGELIHSISWDENNKDCIRNKHGYRNRHKDQGNKKNESQDSAKIDFEKLSHLKNLATDQEFFSVLSQDPTLFINSLKSLQGKIDFILKNNQDISHASNELDFLTMAASYYNDVRCINKLIRLLDAIDYESLDLNNKIDTYFLAYRFVEIGEIAKEISDFLKVKPLKGLFSALEDYRDKIKGTGKIISKKLSQMHNELSESRDTLKTSLNIIKEKLSGYKDANKLKNYSLISKEIENECISLADKLSKAEESLKDGTKNLDKRKKTLEQEIEQLNINLKKLGEEIDSLNNFQNEGFIKEQQELYNFFAKIESGKQGELYKNMDKLFQSLIKEFKKEGYEDVNLKALFSSKNTNEKGFYLQFQRQLKKLFGNSEYENYTKYEALMAAEYCNVIGVILKQYKIKHHIELEAQLKSKQKDLQILEEKQASEVVEVVTKSNITKLSEFDKLIVRVVEETELLQLLYTRITEINIKTAENGLLERIIAAAKMSFGFLGQIHKLLKSEHKNSMESVLISNSILSDDCFSIIMLRHKKLMHDIINSNINHEELSLIIYNNVVPWLKDFKYMPISSKDQGILPEQLVSGLIPEDSRLLADFHTLSENDKRIFYWYTKIVALNRFLQSQRAIDEYKKLQTLLVEVSNMDLLTEIHWQASLAYRNLGEFQNVIKVLKFALEAAKKIKDTDIQNFKVCGIHCDIGIAYIQEDNFKIAEEHFQKVTTNPKASNYQIIGANFLIADVKFLQGYSATSKSHMELIFVKYFEDIIEHNPIMAFSLIEQLSHIYLDECDLEAARDALQLGSEVFKKYYSEFVVQEGQHVIYYKALLQDNISRYHLIEALIKPEEFFMKDIERIYLSILEAQTFRDFLSYFSNKECKKLLLQAAVLTGKKNEVTQPLLLDLKFTENYSLNNILQLVKRNIIEIKKEIFRFQMEPFLEEKKQSQSKIQLEILKHEKILHNLTKEIISFLENAAFYEFYNNNSKISKDLMKKAILYYSIVDFLEFQFEEELNKITQEIVATTDCPVGPSGQPIVYIDQVIFLASLWLDNFNINSQDLINYLNKKLYDQKFTQSLVCSKNSIIKQYEASKDNKKLRKELIAEYEIKLQASIFNEQGIPTTQLKVDEDGQGYIFRSFAATPEGEIYIKEERYRNAQSEDQTPENRGDGLMGDAMTAAEMFE